MLNNDGRNKTDDYVVTTAMLGSFTVTKGVSWLGDDWECWGTHVFKLHIVGNDDERCFVAVMDDSEKQGEGELC